MIFGFILGRFKLSKVVYIKQQLAERCRHLFELYLLIFHSNLYVRLHLKKQTMCALTNRLVTWLVFFLVLTMAFEGITQIDKKIEIVHRSACTYNDYLLKQYAPHIADGYNDHYFLSSFEIKSKSPELVSLVFLSPILSGFEEDDQSYSVNPAALSLDVYPEFCIKQLNEPQKLVVPLGITVAYFENVAPDVVSSPFVTFVYLVPFSLFIALGFFLANIKKTTSSKLYETFALLLVSAWISLSLKSVIKVVSAYFLIDFSIYNYGVEPNTYPFLSHNDSVYAALVTLISSLTTLIVFVALASNLVSKVLEIKRRYALVHLALGYVVLNVIGWLIITPILFAVLKMSPLLSLIFTSLV